MPLTLPLAYFDAVVLEEVSIARWRELFDAIGWLPSLEDQQATFTHADLLSALASDTPSDELLQALEALHVLGSEVGREAIAGALVDRHVAAEELPPELGARELALHVFLRQRTDAVFAEVFVRAQAHAAERGAHRTYHEFVGRDAPAVTDLDAKCQALEAATRAYSVAQDQGGHVQARTFEDDGVLVFHVIRTHHRRKPLAVVAGSASRTTIEYHPVHSDMMRYDVSLGTLRIAARAPSVIEHYRRTLGRMLFDDEDFFSDDAVCSLQVLQEGGRELLERHSVVGIGRVRLTEFLWERGDLSVVQVRSPDCFQQVEELGLQLSEGTLLQAKLKLEVTGKSTRPVTVLVRAPSRIEVSQRQHEALVDTFLRAIGVVGVAPDEAEPDLWSLYPWRHPVAVWRRLFGRETDGLIKANVLRPVRLEAIESTTHPGAGRALTPHDVGGGAYYGVSATPEIPSRSLTATDLDGFELDPERFRRDLRAKIDLSGPAATWDGQSHVLDLGVADFDDVRLRIMYAIRPPDASVDEALRHGGADDACALLIPCPVYSAGPAQAVLPTPLPTRTVAIRSTLAAARLLDRVPAIHTAPSRARLVVDRTRGMIWIDGVHITGLRPGTHPFRFVEHMARSTGPIEGLVLANALSGARDDDTVAARQAKKEAKDAIRDAMRAADRPDVGDPFPSGPVGMYRCVLPSHVA